MNKSTLLEKLDKCNLCPNKCNANRIASFGKCKVGKLPIVAKAYLHKFEEPVLTGKNGSGTVFFSGCTLLCVFCQNYTLSHDNYGKEITPTRLSEIFRELEEKGATNINLVTATPHIYSIIEALNIYRPNIPIVYNSSGYENVETLKLLEGYIDIYLPDFKYYDNSLAFNFSGCKHYLETVIPAISEMIRQVGTPVFEDDILKKGVIIRHLVLPTHTSDSIKVMDCIKENFNDQVLVSLLGQYTPITKDNIYPELNNKITKLEYKRVLNYMQHIGLTKGFYQDLDSSSEIYIPHFDLEGV